MVEENQEKKRPGLVKRILKWIGLIVLLLLLIATLIFQAPWKITALLLVILLACIALPKPARKWFWFSAAAVVIALIIWVFLPDRGEWGPYTFEEGLAELEAKYAIPSEENAATIYTQLLLEEHNEDEFYSKLPESELQNMPIREPWLSKDHPELTEWLQEQQDKITKLLKASKIDKCRFPIKANIVTNNQWSTRSQATRRWVFLLISAASNDIAEARINQAVEKYIAALQMGKHQCQQSTINDTLVGIAIEALAIGQLKRFIIDGDASEERLSLIEKAFAEMKHYWASDLTEILEYEKCSVKREFGRYYEVNPKGEIRLSRDPWAQARARWKQQLESNEIGDQQTRQILESYVYRSFWQKKLIKAKTILLWFYLPSSPQKLDEIFDTIYQNYYKMAKPDFDWMKKPRELTTSLFKFRLNRYQTIELLAGISKKVYYRIHEIHLRHQTEIRASQLIIALRRYKNKHSHWPENLDQVKLFTSAEILVDPLNGHSFVYKLTEKDFILYSKGKNGIDEGGRRERDIGTSYAPNVVDKKCDDWLIWPRKLRKTVTYQGQDFFILSKEDLIVSKWASGREVDLEDVHLLELPDQEDTTS